MSSIHPQPTSAVRTRSASLRRRGVFAAAVLWIGSVAISLTAIPAIVLLIAGGMLVALWPLFVGAYLGSGYVPGDAVRAPLEIGLEWQLLAIAWLVTLFVALPLWYAFRDALPFGSSRRGARSVVRPRARLR